MLISCPECHRQVSDQASNCPGCGFPVEKMNVSAPRTAQPSPAANPLVYVVPAKVAKESPRGAALVCPQCKTDATRRLSILYEEGKSSGSGSTTGMASNFKGGFALVTGFNSTSQQTDLSRACAPPSQDFEDEAAKQLGLERPEHRHASKVGGCLMLLLWPVAAALGGAMGLGIGGRQNEDLGAGLGVLAGTAFIVFAWVWYKQKTAGHAEARERIEALAATLEAKAMEEYNKSFLCLRCGHRFVA